MSHRNRTRVTRFNTQYNGAVMQQGLRIDTLLYAFIKRFVSFSTQQASVSIVYITIGYTNLRVVASRSCVICSSRNRLESDTESEVCILGAW